MAETKPQTALPSPLAPPPLNPGEAAHWTGLAGAATALALASCAAERDGLTVAVVADEHRAYRLEEELKFFAPADLGVYHFPDWETLPYDVFSPHADIVSQRLSLLLALPRMERGILIVAADTLLQPLPPHAFVDGRAMAFAVGERLDFHALRERLEAAGYAAVSEVRTHGEFAIRGAVMDLYPTGSDQPYRLDLFDDEIETIRAFDPETQRSTEKIDSIRLLPAREFPLDEDAIKAFRQRYRQRFDGDPGTSVIYRDISRGIPPGGIESYLALFFDEIASLTDYLPAGAGVIELGDVAGALDTAWRAIVDRHEQRGVNPERPILPPDEAFVTPARLKSAFDEYTGARIIDGETGDTPFAAESVPKLAGADVAATGRALRDFFDTFDGRVLITGDSAGRREALRDWLSQLGLAPARVEGWAEFTGHNKRIAVTAAPLEAGCVLAADGLAVIAENQLTGARPPAKKRRRAPVRDPETAIRELTDLAPGAPVVHQDNGVGRYQGLIKLSAGGIENEFVTIEYAGGDLLYVPVASLHLVHRFTGGDADTAPLHRLGNDRWAKARKKAAQQARDTAADLLEIQAKRESAPGVAMAPDEADYAKFAAQFPFEETPDQQRAIDEVMADLSRATPMDRVVCGDVGFGKTEVALRSAFVAVSSGYQVAVLVPTTLLAQQHYQSFADRFADWPVKIGALSRMRTGKQRDTLLEEMADGKLDIVIGTHRLLAKDIRFKKLGLLIVDEEHRFGVRHKERIKSLRAQVDLLTLTATPIPRTLNMSLSGLRDLSIIATAPESRLAIETFVSKYDGVLLQEAARREMRRGGQIYYVHNKVKDIERKARDLAELLPEARIRIAHGQMHERELEEVMLDFYHRRFDVLLCTTIVESGIDVPSANTIIIDRADTFGLAQLHQLRGRVGRSHHRAYAYLLTPDEVSMTPDAQKRLDALASLHDLGAGFALATHDLEIRGAGELLGEGQSGQIQEIGFDLYRQMLDRAVAAYKRGEVPEADADELMSATEVELGVPALLPEDYIPDVHIRLVLYKRISAAKDGAALRALKVELIDRFGLLPEPTENLFAATSLKLQSAPLALAKLEAGPDVGRLHFGKASRVDPATLITLVQADPRAYRLEGDSKLVFFRDMPDVATRIERIAELLDKLGAPRLNEAEEAVAG
ncbi:transcription-repair coupling factor [Salinisphaera hydrothermalis]|uniref:Transcription-repair-coupling factor n=1 Tax=Salinisphaera hydrothermalis (strain C41B8) TaxID=1304275 RepID=A0A084IJN9_SALHC|nr:transcription-repair coupling factor [Salinisphaera hydrothermalis]KEZ76923.1 transcription-repair coupling factor [Salinisphaera hydrothermalis C41B8]